MAATHFLYCVIRSGISEFVWSQISNIVLYCIVVGSRRIVPPDALQSKAYCTNPGLQSFLLAPPGVSTRDPSSERRNYFGEKWPMKFA